MSSLVWWNLFYSSDLGALFAHECGRVGACIPKSTVLHGKARNGLLACRCFGKNDAVWSYFGSLAYADLIEKSQVTKRNEGKYMEVTVESLCR